MESKKTKNRRILIIDDDEDYSDLLSALLSASGFEVSIRNYGETGLKEAVKSGPDLIVLDIMMPGIHGFYVLEELRKDERTAKTPVVVVSTMGRAEVQAAAARYGADFIPKDGQLDKVVAGVKKRLGAG